MNNTVTVIIRNNLTREVREYETDYHPALESNLEIGNYSCDCNRHILFTEAGNNKIESIQDIMDIECSEWKYSIPYIINNGEFIEIE
jgi:hypothetical protein